MNLVASRLAWSMGKKASSGQLAAGSKRKAPFPPYFILITDF